MYYSLALRENNQRCAMHHCLSRSEAQLRNEVSAHMPSPRLPEADSRWIHAAENLAVQATLNDFMQLGHESWSTVRQLLLRSLCAYDPSGRGTPSTDVRLIPVVR